MAGKVNNKLNITFKKDNYNNILSFYEDDFLICEIYYGNGSINTHIIYERKYYNKNKLIKDNEKNFNQIKEIREKISFFDLYSGVF